MEIKFNLFELEPLIITHSINDPIFFLKIKSYIKPNYFQNNKIGKIFEIISNFHDKYNSLPKKETLLSLFKKKYEDKAADYLSIIDLVYDYKGKYDNQYINDSTISFVKQAKVIEAIRTSIPQIEEGKYDEIYENIKKAVVIDFDRKLGLNFKKDAIITLKETNKKRIPTGFNCLDAVLCGGFEGGNIYTISGNYGIGKSIWLQNIGVKQLFLNKNVIIYTLELTEKAYNRRLSSIYTQIALSNLEDNMVEVEKQFQTLNMTSESNLFIKQYPTGTATTNNFRAHLEEMKTIHGFIPDIVIVDYCSIMDSLKHVSMENTYVRTRTLFEELRAVAIEYDIPILTASQINRGGLDEKKGGTKQLVTGANLSDSLGIAMTVDVHLIINQTAEEKLNSLLRLYVDKNRQGPDKITKTFGIDYTTLTINENIEII